MKDKLKRGITGSRAAALAVALTILATLSVSTMLVYAGDHAGRWGATAFQLYNLDTQDAEVTVTFYDDDGSKALSFDDTLPPGGTRFYEPEVTHGLPTTFTGQLHVDTDQNVFGVVHHFADPTEPTDGNVIHRLLATSTLTTSIYLPYVDWNHDGWFTVIRLQNPHGEAVTASVTYYDLNGTPVGQHLVPVAPYSTRIANSPPGFSFVGSAWIQTPKPILVVASRWPSSGQQRTAYNGQSSGSPLLRAPYVHSDYSLIAVQNTSGLAAEVQVTFHWPQAVKTLAATTETITATVAPLATHIFTSTQSVAQGRALVTGTQPLAAVVATEQTGLFNAAWCYNALHPERASQCVVAPSLLHDYKGWHAMLWIQNLDSTEQEVEVLYTAAPTGTLAYTRTPKLPPYTTYPMLGNWLPPTFQHAAALVVGSGKVGVLVHQVDYNILAKDGVMDYEGYTANACVIPAPKINLVTPSASPAAGTTELTVGGRNFQWGATVALSRTGQAPIVASDVSATGATTLTAQMDLTGAVPGSWDVVVTNADGRTDALHEGFKVLYQLYLPLAMKG